MKKILIISFLFLSSLCLAQKVIQPIEHFTAADRVKILETYEQTALAGNSVALLPTNPLRVRYVNRTATGSGNGLSDATAWTLSQAVANAIAGDLVWVKAGEYGQQNLVQTANGTASNPIYFIGYQNTINDINATSYSTFKIADYRTNSNDINSNDLVTITGQSQPENKYNRNGTAFTVGGEYVVVRNFQFRRLFQGLYFNNAGYNVAENIVAVNNKWDGAPIYNNSDSDGDGIGDAEGTGLRVRRSPRTVVRNCIGINNGFRNFMHVHSDYVLTIDTESHADGPFISGEYNSVDYFFVTIAGEDDSLARFNLYENCRVFRYYGNTTGGGHGFCFNTNASQNMLKNCTSNGVAVHIHGVNSAYNVWDNLTINGGASEYPSASFGFSAGDFNMLDGATENYIVDSFVDDSYYAVSFNDSGKEGGFETAGDNNTFVRLTVQNMMQAHTEPSTAIKIFWESTDQTESSFDNMFIDSDISNMDYMFEPYKPNYGFKFIDVRINNVDNFLRPERPNRGGYKYPDGMNYNTEFRRVTLTNSFTIPAGFNINNDTDPTTPVDPPVNPPTNNFTGNNLFNKEVLKRVYY